MNYRAKVQLLASLLVIGLITSDVAALKCKGKGTPFEHGKAPMCTTESSNAVFTQTQSCLSKEIAGAGTCKADKCTELNIRIKSKTFSDTDDKIWSVVGCFSTEVEVTICAADLESPDVTTTESGGTVSGDSPTTEAPTTTTAPATTTGVETTTSTVVTVSTVSTSTVTYSTTTTPTDTTTTATTSPTTTTMTTTTPTTTTMTTTTPTTTTTVTETSGATSSTTTATDATSTAMSTTDGPTTTPQEPTSTDAASTTAEPTAEPTTSSSISTTASKSLPKFTGCLTGTLNFTDSCTAEMKSVSAQWNNGSDSNLMPTLQVQVVGCCNDKDFCRVDDGVTKEHTCNYGDDDDTVSVDCESDCFSYVLNPKSSDSVVKHGCLTDIDLSESSYSGVTSCTDEYEAGTCSTASGNQECIRCCDESKCNDWSADDLDTDEEKNSASFTTTSVLLVIGAYVLSKL